MRGRAVRIALMLAAACGEERFESRTESQWVSTLRSGATKERIWAAGALGRMKAQSTAAQDALIAALQDSSDAISIAAADAIAATGGSDVRDYVLTRVFPLARNEHSPERVAAIEVLGKEPYADARSVPILVGALRDPSPGVRATAAMTLGRLGGAARPAVSALHEVLRDTNELVRHEAQDAITAISGVQYGHKQP